jgi:uncharacterized protein (DUF2147 family)
MRRAAISMVLAFAAGVAGAAEADAILGVWATDPEADAGLAHVEILKTGDSYEGRIVWLEIPRYEPGDEHGVEGEAKVDTENPDPSLRERPIIGLTILRGFRYGGDSNWVKGSIYDPENGKTYRCKMRLMEDGRLKVRGFVGVSMFGRTEMWTRVGAEGGPRESG